LRNREKPEESRPPTRNLRETRPRLLLWVWSRCQPRRNELFNLLDNSPLLKVNEAVWNLKSFLHLLHGDGQKDEGRSYEHKLVCPSSILLFNIREIAKSRFI